MQIGNMKTKQANRQKCLWLPVLGSFKAGSSQDSDAFETGTQLPLLPTGEVMHLLTDPSNGWNSKRNIPTAKF